MCPYCVLIFLWSFPHLKFYCIFIDKWEYIFWVTMLWRNVASFDFAGAHSQESVISLKGDFSSKNVRIISMKTFEGGLDEFGIKDCA